MYNTVLHKAKVWKREMRATMAAATGWGIGGRPNSSLEDCRTGFCCSFLKFQWCAAYKLAVDVTEWQRRRCSEGVCKSGSTLSHGERVQGSFNATPVRAQLRSRIQLDPACAAVGPVWISRTHNTPLPSSPYSLLSELSPHTTMKLICKHKTSVTL